MSDTLSLLSLALTLRPVEAVAAGTGRVPHVGRAAHALALDAIRQTDPALVVEYEFEKKGEYTVACSVQDDQGGERPVVQTLNVT